jgi:arabinofuranan 3-O-arabinosyltransferase
LGALTRDVTDDEPAIAVAERNTETSPDAQATYAPGRIDRWTDTFTSRFSARTQRVLGYVALALLAYVPPLLSSPGKVAADTKTYLYLNPGRLMARALSMWDPHVAMGTVTHQTIGYLFPMGPYYWALEGLGVPAWVAQRLWLGSLLFFAALGVLYLFRTFDMRGPGIVVAALAFMCTPYVLDYSARISVLLLPWAALPWMIGLIRKALRDGGWRYPALFAIVVQIVGGVNATALIFAGVGPVLWILYAWLVAREVRFGQALRVTARTFALTLGTSLWWIAGLRMQGTYGLDVLKYSETVQTVARTSTPNEVLRGLGYWFFYGQDLFGSWIEAARDYTQHPVVLVAGYALVALALLGAAFVRWRHRVFFLALLVVGVVISVGAHPYDTPTPLGSLFKKFQTSSTAGLALRSTGRATPLVVLALAVFLGLAVNWVSKRYRGSGRIALALGVPALVIALVFVNFPALVNGTFYGKNLERPESVPAYWQRAISALNAGDHQTRILEEPGSDFASYTWGNTVDPITPGLTDRPYVARELIPFGTPAGANLLMAIDRRIQEGVADPNGLTALWRRMGIGDVVARNDIQWQRYNLVQPTELARLLANTPGLGTPTGYGPTSMFQQRGHADETTLSAPANQQGVPSVAIYPVANPTPIVRGESLNQSLMISGDGDGLVDAADIGLLDNAGVVQYSASNTTPAAVRGATQSGAVLVVTDENRLRALRWSEVRDNLGFTEQAGAADAPLQTDPGDARLDVFPNEQASARTTTDDIGIKQVRVSSCGNDITYTSENRGAMAFDGDPQTSWWTAAFGPVEGQQIQVTLDAPITTDHINLLQVTNKNFNRHMTGVDLIFDGKSVVHARLTKASLAQKPPGQTVTFGRRTFSKLAIVVTSDNLQHSRLLSQASAVGFAEIGLRDEHATHDLRLREVEQMPTDLTEALGPGAATHPLVYIMRRDNVRDVPPRSQPEHSINRSFDVPNARTFQLAGNATITPDAPAVTVATALGIPNASAGGVTEEASKVLPSCLACSPGAAIDGNPSTAWQTPFVGASGQYVEYKTPQPITFDHLDLQIFADGRHSKPRSLNFDVNGVQRVVNVPALKGTPVPNTVRSVRVSFPAITGSDIKITVGTIDKVLEQNYGGGPRVAPVAIAEFGIPGLRAPASTTQINSGCRSDLVAIDGRPVPVRITGPAAKAGVTSGLAVSACDGPVHLSAGRHEIDTAPGSTAAYSLDRIVLASSASGSALEVQGGHVQAAPTPPAAPRVQVVGQGSTHVRVRVSGATSPFMLVLGQSQSSGWQAHIVSGQNLGGSQLVDGYANGWLINPKSSTFDVAMDWTPQRQVWLAIWLTVAFMLLCIGIAVVTWRRRIKSAARPGDADVDIRWGGYPHLEGRTRWVAVVASALVAGVMVTPWVGILVGGAAFALTAPWRRFVLVMPAVLLAFCGLYMVWQQAAHRFPSVFEWPTLFPLASTPAWIAIAILAADLVIAIAQRSSSPPSVSER